VLSVQSIMNAAWREVSGHWKHHVAKSPEDSRRAREHAKRNLHHALHHVFNHSYHVGEDGGIRRVWWGAGGDEDDGSITLLDSASWSQLAFVWGVPTLFAYVAYRKRSVDWTGAVGGWLVAFSCCLAGFQVGGRGQWMLSLTHSLTHSRAFPGFSEHTVPCVNL